MFVFTAWVNIYDGSYVDRQGAQYVFLAKVSHVQEQYKFRNMASNSEKNILFLRLSSVVVSYKEFTLS